VRLDEPITTEVSAGRPVRFTTARGRCYQVRRVLGVWQAPGESRLYRLQVAAPDGLAVAEVVGPDHAAGEAASWRLCRIWT
jgi:hypothetical protein